MNPVQQQPSLTLEPPAEPVLTFEPEGHIYKLGDEVLPSVTQALEATRLIDYSHIPPRVLAEAAARGTAVHVALHYLDEGSLDEDSLDPLLTGYIMAYVKFQRESGFTPGYIEHRVWNPIYRYAGTMDRTGMLGEELVLLDFKTGDVLPGHALQLAAYNACLPEPRKWRRIALKLSADGIYRVNEFPAKSYHDDLQVFLSALACVRWLRAHNRRGV